MEVYRDRSTCANSGYQAVFFVFFFCFFRAAWVQGYLTHCLQFHQFIHATKNDPQHCRCGNSDGILREERGFVSENKKEPGC